MSLTLKEVLATLKGEGVPVTHSRINYAILAGHVSKPPQDGAGNNKFAECHLDELRRYLASPRRCGRKARPQDAEAAR